MAQITLPYFGQIDLDDLDESYDTKMVLTGKEIDLDLNFDEESIEIDRMESIKKFLEGIEGHLLSIKEYIINDYQDEEVEDSVRFYLQFHKDEMGEEELCKQLNISTDGRNPDRQLIARLEAVRIGIYPSGEDYFAIFDYSFGREFTNYIVVISTDENGKLVNVTVES